MSVEVGNKAIYNLSMKMLTPGTIGVIVSLWGSGMCTISYPQNASFFHDENGNYKPIKNDPLQVSSHSAKLTDITTTP